MGPDGELIGVVVHSGLVLGQSKDVVAAVRRITAFPGGLVLDTVVLARDIRAEAAGRREHERTRDYQRKKSVHCRTSGARRRERRRRERAAVLLGL